MGEQKPLHILAKPEDVAERVVVAGDPARVRQLAGMLDGARLVNENRGFLTYTGRYEGVEVTVATHGIGAPSAAIVFEELIVLGARAIVRLGTCGGMVSGMAVGDVVIPYGAAHRGGGTLGMYIADGYLPAVPHPHLLSALVESAEELGVSYRLGVVFSSDAFYAEDPEFVRRWSSRGVVAVEMECATLFTLGLLRRVKTGALLVVSDVLVEGPAKEMATAEELREVVERAAHVAFRALLKAPLD
ncbi:MAG: nucleoside phosphorylase [Thermoprotei archaeon]|nr:MAG: nucleoside phosphorylase [Thermoprotei archaeon]